MVVSLGKSKGTGSRTWQCEMANVVAVHTTNYFVHLSFVTRALHFQAQLFQCVHDWFIILCFGMGMGIVL